MNFSIDSVDSKNSIRFSQREPEYFTVHLTGSVQASCRVCTYTDEFGLMNFFQKLAKTNKPWNGVLHWKSLDEKFQIFTTCSSLGHVIFEVRMHGLAGYPEEWNVKVGITSDFGQLSSYSTSAERFFGVK